MTKHVSSIRRISISRTVSGPEVAAGWCKDALHRLLDGRIMSRSDLLFCLSNRRINHNSTYSSILAPETTGPPASCSSAWTQIAMKTHQSDFSICECDLLAQEVILAHSATPGCCFNLMSMAPNNVRQYISDMSACKQHPGSERVRSLLRQSDDMLVAAWCVTHGKECRIVHSDTHTHTAGNTCTDPPDDGGVPLLQRHERNIRFQLAAVDGYKALVVEHGIKLGSRNEAVAVPDTLADICGREVTVFHFVGGATLVEAFYAADADFQEDMKQKRPDTLQRYNQVSATLNGGLTDVTLLDERTPPDVLDHFISVGNALRGVGAKSSFMERYLKTSIIEEKWQQKRKQEAEERRLQKKRRESTFEGRGA